MSRPMGVFVGHSHLTCFGVPLRSPGGRTELAPLAGSGGAFMHLAGEFPRLEDYWVEAEKLAKTHRLLISWRGNQHMAAHLFASDPLFDFVLSDEPDLPLVDGAVVIPEQMLREKFSPSFDRLVELLDNVHQDHRGIVICGTPPPRHDTATIRASLSHEPHFADLLRRSGLDAESVSLTPTATLYKMWRVIQAMLRDVADSRGVEFVAIPSASQTPDGFIRPEFWSSDVTHANQEFGNLMMRHLQAYL